MVWGRNRCIFKRCEGHPCFPERSQGIQQVNQKVQAPACVQPEQVHAVDDFGIAGDLMATALDELGRRLILTALPTSTDPFDCFNLPCRRIRYFRRFLAPGVRQVRLYGVYQATVHDDDMEFYR